MILKIFSWGKLKPEGAKTIVSDAVKSLSLFEKESVSQLKSPEKNETFVDLM